MIHFTQYVPWDFNVFLGGDDHLGTELRYDEGFKIMLRMLFEKYEGVGCNMLYHMGDPLDAIFLDDFRYAPEVVRDKEDCLMRQIDDYSKMIAPFSERVKIIMDGRNPRRLLASSKHAATLTGAKGIIKRY